MRAAGEKLEIICAAFEAPHSTVQWWTRDMPRRRGRPWCPPELRAYNKELTCYWRIPVEMRKKIIAAVDPSMTNREKRRVMHNLIKESENGKAS
jgi:hypothetical protein